MKLERLILTISGAILWTQFLLTNSSFFFGNQVDSPQPITPVAVATPTSTPTPPVIRTWRERVQETARAGGSRDVFQGRSDRQLFYPRDYSLPEEYYNGLAYLVGGTAETYIIYREGLSAPPLPPEYWGTQYEIAPDAIKPAIRSGQAISLTMGTRPGPNVLKVWAEDGANSPSVSDWRNSTRIESTTLSVEEMKRILRSGRPIPARP